MTHIAPSSNWSGHSPFKAGMSGSSPVGAIIAPSYYLEQVANLSRWRYGFESRWGDLDSKLTRSSGGLKHRRSSFDSNTVHLVREKRARSLFGAQDLVVGMVCKTVRDGSNPSVHLRSGVNGQHPGLWILRYRFKSDDRCASFVQWKGQRISNPPIRVRVLYEAYGHVA